PSAATTRTTVATTTLRVVAWLSSFFMTGQSSSAQIPVEAEGGADQREVRERLGEVSELLAARADLLGVEAEVVRVREHLLEGQPRLVHPAGARERLDVPEAADRERPLVAVEPVRRRGRVVAVDEAVGDELASDRVERREPARILRRDEVDERHQE